MVTRLLLMLVMSLPPRERGLKLFSTLLILPIVQVAPSAGAWIETLREVKAAGSGLVAPSAGAWIETSVQLLTPVQGSASLPPRERGLKQATRAANAAELGRSLRGSVD